MAIRVAVRDDVEAVMLLLVEFATKYSDYKYSLHNMHDIVVGSIETGCTLVSEKDGKVTGCIVGMIHDHPFLICRALSELAWYSKDTYGGLLLAKFVKLGKSLGVDCISASTLADSPDTAEKIMALAGFDKSETGWRMNL